MCLAPTHVHSHQHRSPVLALCASCAGVDFEHDPEFVFLAAKHIAELKALDFVDSRGIHGIELALFHLALLDKFPCNLQLLHGIFNFGIAVNPRLDIFDFLHLCLRFLGMFPKIRHMGAEFLLFDFYFLAVDVKDTSSTRACVQKSLLAVPV